MDFSEDESLTSYSYSSIDSGDSEFRNQMYGITPEEKKMDEDYENEIVQHRQLQCLRSVPQTLQLKAMQQVASLIVNGARTGENLVNFTSLPAGLQQLLVKHMAIVDEDEDEILSHYSVVSQLLTPLTSWLKMIFLSADDYHSTWQGWDAGRVQLITDQICSRQNILHYLEIQVNDSSSDIPSEVQLQAMVTSQASSLRELRLSGTDLTNSTLRLIVSMCPQLEVLDVSDNPRVSGRGLAPLDHSSSLKKLYCQGTKISLRAISNVLQRFQDTVIEVNIFNDTMGGGWIRLLETNPAIILSQYDVLMLDLSEDALQNIYPLMVEKVKNIRKLHLEGVDNRFVISGFKNLTDLTLHVQEVPQELESALINLSSTLQSLIINSSNFTIIQSLSMQSVAECVHLKTLQLTNLKLITNNPDELTHGENFASMTEIKLHCVSTSVVSDRMWVSLLSSEKLESIETSLKIPEHVLLEVISFVHTSPKVLGELKSITLTNPSRYRFDTWCQLLCVCANGTTITCNSIMRDDDMKKKLVRFAQRNSIRIHIEDSEDTMIQL